jgi:hypothetical protein
MYGIRPDAIDMKKLPQIDLLSISKALCKVVNPGVFLINDTHEVKNSPLGYSNSHFAERGCVRSTSRSTRACQTAGIVRACCGWSRRHSRAQGQIENCRLGYNNPQKS